ncbi:MAG: NADH-quinone oxidoreductase subunit G [Propionibacteriaceae bacterium]|jgi:NADH-quinone oxidoreductase subunit G|nr:NADH-quinone oxidoreductase subunit G [Propionibacteriaceae bacterium]
MSDIVASDLVTLTIDGIEVSVPKGTTIIRAAESIGIAIPRFCDHPLLDPRGSCRQCLVEIPDAGNGRGFPVPQTSCTMPVAPGMVVQTAASSEKAKRAQNGIMELLLINHPLDCPICDKGGECPLQNQALLAGRGESRFDAKKRRFPKPTSINGQLLLDRERCVLCARCTRFAQEIADDPYIALVERGALQQVGRVGEGPLRSYYLGNVVQICPVGAFTAKSYRFESRPFDLVSTDTTCEHCASGCSLRVDRRHGTVRRRLAGNNPSVNEEWNCDKGRFCFVYGRGADRLTHPLIRENGSLRPASWPEALAAAAAGLSKAEKSVGVLTGGRLTTENAYAYSKFARAVLGTNSIDFRSRPFSVEETDFLAAEVAGKEVGVSYGDLENASQVVLVGIEPEDESPMILLRLIKAVRKRGLKVVLVDFINTYGSKKLKARWIQCRPGEEAKALAQVELDEKSVILVGERAALSAGTLSAVAKLSAEAGASWAWIPRRAGDFGAVQAGCLPNVLPGGRPVTQSAARVDVAAAWEVDSLPGEIGLDAAAILAAAAEGDLAALVTAGIDPRDFADSHIARAALEQAFVVSLEPRLSQAASLADVVLPVALIEEQSGSFLNWEGRQSVVNQVVKGSVPSDLRVLSALADELGSPLGLKDAAAAAAELGELGVWEGSRAALSAVGEKQPGEGLILGSWRELFDAGSGADGEESLQTESFYPTAVMNPKTAAGHGFENGDRLVVSGPRGSITVPLLVYPDIVEDVIWASFNARGLPSHGEIGVVIGEPVNVGKEEAKV